MKNEKLHFVLEGLSKKVFFTKREDGGSDIYLLFIVVVILENM